MRKMCGDGKGAWVRTAPLCQGFAAHLVAQCIPEIRTIERNKMNLLGPPHLQRLHDIVANLGGGRGLHTSQQTGQTECAPTSKVLLELSLSLEKPLSPSGGGRLLRNRLGGTCGIPAGSWFCAGNGCFYSAS